MDIMKSLQSVIDTLQQITIQATYSNISKMGGALEELVKIGDAVKPIIAKSEKTSQDNDTMGG